MGCDIHWLIERHHPEGGWQAVLWDSFELQRYFPADGSKGLDYDFKDPAIAFGMRSYTWFGILSAVRQNEDGPHLATEGMPTDASAFAVEALEWENPSDLHSHGHITLDALREAITARGDKPPFHEDQDRMTARHYLSQLDALIARSGPEGPSKILAGYAWDEHTGEHRCERSRLSNHEQMRLAEWERSFPPAQDKDYRLMIAYDN